MSLKGNLNDFMSANINKEGVTIYAPIHPSRSCIYKEASVVAAMRKDKPEIINPQMNRYKEEGFPENYGLLQSNILVRYHNDPSCIKLMETWSEEVMNGSHRDQLSFNYASWKNDDVPVAYLRKDIYRSQWFDWKSGHAKKGAATKNLVKKPTIAKKTDKKQSGKTLFEELIERKKAKNSVMYNTFNQY